MTVVAVRDWKIAAAGRISDCEDFLKNEVVRALAENDRADDLRDCVTVREFLCRRAEIAGNHFDPDDEWSGRGPTYEADRWAGSVSPDNEE